jgi:hypothetical protein
LLARRAGVERTLSYVEAIREATDLEMGRDPSVILFGLDVDDPKAIQGTARGLVEKYGSERVFGTPLSEDAMTGAAVGMALAGLRPIHVHIRMDFLLLAMNQLVNVAAKTRSMYGGRANVPLVVRSMIGKSWGQGAQHSQGLHSLFMHVPGLKVVAPATPYDAKGCLAAAGATTTRCCTSSTAFCTPRRGRCRKGSTSSRRAGRASPRPATTSRSSASRGCRSSASAPPATWPTSGSAQR